MIRNKLSAALLALLLAVTIPGTASAIDIYNESTPQPDSTTIQASDAVSGDVTSEQETAEQSDSDELNAGELLPENALDPETDLQAGTGIEPKADETADADEFEVDESADADEPEADNEEVDEEGQYAAEQIFEENINDEAIEDTDINGEANAEESLTEELSEEEIIENPVTATLTIMQRLIVDDKYMDETVTVEGLTVGDSIDITPYIWTDEWLTFVGNINNITLNEEQNTIVLEYKPAPGVVVVLPEDIPEDEPGEIH